MNKTKPKKRRNISLSQEIFGLAQEKAEKLNRSVSNYIECLVLADKQTS